jgi:hypothetical protein
MPPYVYSCRDNIYEHRFSEPIPVLVPPYLFSKRTIPTSALANLQTLAIHSQCTAHCSRCRLFLLTTHLYANHSRVQKIAHLQVQSTLRPRCRHSIRLSPHQERLSWTIHLASAGPSVRVAWNWKRSYMTIVQLPLRRRL